MDDLLLFTPSKNSHMAKFEDLLKVLLKNGLQISPKKCQLFRTNLNYMGNEIFIQNKRVCMKPNAIVDHLSLTHIIKSKAEPATIRIKRLLELISSYSFNLYYIKGKDMVLSDFLSRQNNDDSNPHEIIPISFNKHKVLQENYYKIDSYLVQTGSQARSSGY